MQGRVRGVNIHVILDTGADMSLVNSALRDALASRVGVSQSAEDAVRTFTAGSPVVLDTVVAIPRMTLGDLEVDAVHAYLGDLHVFELWGLAREPTLLLGMDVLSRLSAFAIDYGRGVVYFRLPGNDMTSVDLHGAGSRLDRPER